MARSGDDLNSDEPKDPLLDSEPQSGGREERAGFVSELVRKVAVAGMGAVFMGEEGLRSLGAQLKLPKELLGAMLSQAEKTKGDLGRVLSEELRRFLQSEKLRDEVLKLLSGMTIEVKAEVRLVPRKPAASAEPAEEGGEGDEEENDEGRRLVVSELSARRHSRPPKDTP